ncbi:MAG: hypothetical protein HZA31_07205 [Opitutae bacterium]|nr:hypothetical protein [Opitutae bacterium]
MKKSYHPPGRTLSHRGCAIVVLTLCLVLSGFAARDASQPRNNAVAKAAKVAPADPFDPFRLIGERNIFNPNRVGASNRSAVVEPAGPVGDTITLVGTLESEQGLYAFFDCDDPSFRKVLAPGAKIAGYTVAQVQTGSIALERDAKTTPLRVTGQLHRAEGGDWTIVTGEAVRRETPLIQSGPERAGTGSSLPAIPPDASEVLKRLMEKRQQQLKE